MTWIITVAIRKYQTSIDGKGTVKVKGKKIVTSNKDVMPIKERGFLLDFIIALHTAWHSAEKRINMKIKFTDKVIAWYEFTSCLSK